jgi:transcriptional regulator with XRE-family HTH domain
VTSPLANRRQLKLKRRLRALGITQEAIAKRAGVTRTYINHFLNGRRSPERLYAVVAGLMAEAAYRRKTN